jgi:hypothetical protein
MGADKLLYWIWRELPDYAERYMEPVFTSIWSVESVLACLPAISLNQLRADSRPSECARNGYFSRGDLTRLSCRCIDEQQVRRYHEHAGAAKERLQALVEH